jgi:hypothetical protein
VDTLVSRLSQAQPAPKFLTEGADYRQRHLAQQLNHFVLGEFHQAKVYEKAVKMLRDGMVMGPGVLKVSDGGDGKVVVDRVMATDLYVDESDSLNGEPQQLIQLKLVDRDRLLTRCSEKAKKKIIAAAPASYPDSSPSSSKSTSDQVMVVEGWKLASGPDPKAVGYKPGRHTISVLGGAIFDEEWHKTKFPFVFFNYSEPFLGFFGQGVATQLFGTQLALNRILYTIARAITLVGVPRIFQENSSKVVSSHHNNEVGVVVKYTGAKPSYETAPCNAPELYAERDKLIQYGFQQTGVSAMQATAQKPGGLNSGEAIRSYDDISTDRFAAISKRYENVFVELAYLVVDTAMDIAEREGGYQTVYPNKDGTKEIDLPKIKMLKDPFVIQCFTESSLPRTPAGRIASVTEMVTSGMLSLKEGKRLMKVADLEQNDKLDNASEERIFQILDKIVEDGEYTPPDPFIDLELAKTLVVQYINLYLAANLEEDKADMLRLFFSQCNILVLGTQPVAPAALPAPAPTVPPAPIGAPPAQMGVQSAQ